jgi:hypothetical protein
MSIQSVYTFFDTVYIYMSNLCTAIVFLLLQFLIWAVIGYC